MKITTHRCDSCWKDNVPVTVLTGWNPDYQELDVDLCARCAHEIKTAVASVLDRHLPDRKIASGKQP